MPQGPKLLKRPTCGSLSPSTNRRPPHQHVKLQATTAGRKRSKIMSTSSATDVIQGDEQSRDGHYHAKPGLASKPRPAPAEPAAELDPNALISLQAQNPFTLDKVRVGSASEEAAGIPAIWNTMLYGIGKMGPIRSSEVFLKINHVTGFDCQSCAWPTPTKSGKSSNFAKTAPKQSPMSRPRSVSRRNFSPSHSIADLAGQSDYWLNQQGRLTSPIVQQSQRDALPPIRGRRPLP